MRVLLIGDIVGRGGRKAVSRLTMALRKEYDCTFCIANAENCAGGAGLTEAAVMELKAQGVDVVTGGDHIWDQRDFVGEIQHLPFVLRPANYAACQPGKGYHLFHLPRGGDVAVISLIGRVFMKPEADCPFTAADRILNEIGNRTKAIFVDMHAEATSEKIAMGRHLEGRVTAVWGSHTHVQTADEEVFEGGTAYISDLGMVGARKSVLGRDVDDVLHKFRTGMPIRFRVVDSDIRLCGAVVDFDPRTGRASAIERVVRDDQPD